MKEILELVPKLRPYSSKLLKKLHNTFEIIVYTDKTREVRNVCQQMTFLERRKDDGCYG